MFPCLLCDVSPDCCLCVVAMAQKEHVYAEIGKFNPYISPGIHQQQSLPNRGGESSCWFSMDSYADMGGAGHTPVENTPSVKLLIRSQRLYSNPEYENVGQVGRRTSADRSLSWVWRCTNVDVARMWTLHECGRCTNVHTGWASWWFYALRTVSYRASTLIWRSGFLNHLYYTPWFCQWIWWWYKQGHIHLRELGRIKMMLRVINLRMLQAFE